MEWLNLHASDLDSPEFVGSSPVERATWLCLQRFCIGQENGGVIANAGAWPDRKWQQLARVTQREVAAKNSALWTWKDDDLHVWHYPLDKQNEVVARRENARKNGRLSNGRPNKKTPSKTDEQPTPQTDQQPTSETNTKPTSVISAKAEGERKGKGKEGNRKGRRTEPPASAPQADPSSNHAPASSSPASASDAPSAKARPKNINEVDGFFAQFGAPREEAESFWNHYTANGWRVGKVPMQDWHAAARGWLSRWRKGLYGKSTPASLTPRTPPAAPFDPSAPHAHTGGLPEAGADEPPPPAPPSTPQPSTENPKPSE